MLHIRLNDETVKAARAAIAAGRVVESADLPARGQLAATHLGIVAGKPRDTAAAHVAPILTTDGRLVVVALAAARAEFAGVAGCGVFAAAGELLAAIPSPPAPADLIRLVGAGRFAAVELDPVEWADLPERLIQLLPFGEVRCVDGRSFRVTELSLVSIRMRWEARQNQIVVDYDHGTYGGDGRAAGWIFDLVCVNPAEAGNPDDVEARYGATAREAVAAHGAGVYAVVRWTKAAADAIAAREYRYISPVIRWDDDLQVTELCNAALVNDPAIDGMMPVAASAQPPADGAALGSVQRPARASGAASDTRGDSLMDWQKMAAQLGIQAKDEAEFLAKLAALQASSESNAAQVAALAADLERERTAALTRQAQADVTAAVAAGRIPADKAEKFLALAVSNRAAFDAALELLPTPTAPAAPPQGRMSRDPNGQGDQAGTEHIIAFNNLPATATIRPEVLLAADREWAKARSNSANSAETLRRLAGSGLTMFSLPAAAGGRG